MVHVTAVAAQQREQDCSRQVCVGNIHSLNRPLTSCCPYSWTCTHQLNNDCLKCQQWPSTLHISTDQLTLTSWLGASKINSSHSSPFLHQTLIIFNILSLTHSSLSSIWAIPTHCSLCQSHNHRLHKFKGNNATKITDEFWDKRLQQMQIFYTFSWLTLCWQWRWKQKYQAHQ